MATSSRESYLTALAYLLGTVAAAALLFWVLPIAVWRNYSNAAVRMSRLPGISPQGGLPSGVIMALYHLLTIMFIAAAVTLFLEPPTSIPSPA